MQTVRLAVYGSLRQGMGNHPMLADAKYLGTTTLTGYKLYSIDKSGSYPYVVSDKSKSPLVVEVYEVSAEVFGHIYEMEVNAGYRLQEIATNFDEAVIFVYDTVYENIYNEETGIREAPGPIASGDWVKYKEEKNETVQSR